MMTQPPHEEAERLRRLREQDDEAQRRAFSRLTPAEQAIRAGARLTVTARSLRDDALSPELAQHPEVRDKLLKMVNQIIRLADGIEREAP